MIIRRERIQLLSGEERVKRVKSKVRRAIKGRLLLLGQTVKWIRSSRETGIQNGMLACSCHFVQVTFAFVFTFLPPQPEQMTFLLRQVNREREAHSAPAKSTTRTTTSTTGLCLPVNLSLSYFY